MAERAIVLTRRASFRRLAACCTALIACFTLAVTLAAVGLYGVMAYFVAERRREIGIRVALGATRQGIITEVLGEALRLSMMALIIGAFAAQIVTRLLSSMLFGIGSTDVVTYATVGALLTGVSLLASYLPARSAAQVDPIVALREQ